MDHIDIINSLIKENKTKQYKLAAHIGTTASALSEILNRKSGRKFAPEHIQAIADYFKVTTDFIYGNELTPISNYIPLIGKASCGKPAEYDLNGYDPVPVADDMYQEGMYAIESEGESMLPMIAPGDILYCLCENCTQINNGNIVHYSIDGESGVKKYKINEAGTIISLIPINTEYDVITIHHDDKVDLRLSKVVGRYSRF